MPYVAFWIGAGVASVLWALLLLACLSDNDKTWSEAHKRGMTADELRDRRKRGYR